MNVQAAYELGATHPLQIPKKDNIHNFVTILPAYLLIGDKITFQQRYTQSSDEQYLFICSTS